MEKPTIKDKAIQSYVDHLEKKLNELNSSPYYGTYITIRRQIDNFNDQLTIREQKSYVNDDGIKVTVNPGVIDLFADKDSKEFDRVWKYMLEAVELNKKLDELRKMMNPEEVKRAEKALKDQNIPLAEKIALNNGR